MASIYGSVQRQDWNDRDFTEIIARNIKKIADFLNHFDQSCRGKLAELNEKVTKLERQMDFLEAAVGGAEMAAAANQAATTGTANSSDNGSNMSGATAQMQHQHQP